MTAGYQPDRCTCSHVIGEHQSAGTRWPYPPSYGVCLVPGCECCEFTLRNPSSRKEPSHDQDQDHRDRDHPDRPDVAACTGRGRSHSVLLGLVHTRMRALTTGLTCGGALGILTILLAPEVFHAL